MTQCEIVLQELRKGRKLTSMDGINDLGIQQFPSRISELRQQGHNIADEVVEHTDRRGKKGSHKLYWLVSAAPAVDVTAELFPERQQPW